MRIFIGANSGVRERGGRVLRRIVEMYVTEGDQDLRYQRNERQRHAVSLLAMNPTHPSPAYTVWLWE